VGHEQRRGGEARAAWGGAPRRSLGREAPPRGRRLAVAALNGFSPALVAARAVDKTRTCGPTRSLGLVGRRDGQGGRVEPPPVRPRRRAAPAAGSRVRPGARHRGGGRHEVAEQTAALDGVGDRSDAPVVVALGGWQPRQTCPPSSSCHARLVGPTAQCSLQRGCTQAENRHVFGCKDLLAPLTVPCGQIFSTSGLPQGFAWIALVNFISQEAPRGGADGECKRTQFHAATLRFGVRQQPHVSNPARILR